MQSKNDLILKQLCRKRFGCRANEVISQNRTLHLSTNCEACTVDKFHGMDDAQDYEYHCPEPRPADAESTKHLQVLVEPENSRVFFQHIFFELNIADIINHIGQF